MPTCYLLIQGKVQGVFFRASAKKEAVKLGLTGWIRNTPSREVEALISGGIAALDQFITWCRKGPDLATVSALFVEERPEEEFADFTIEH